MNKIIIIGNLTRDPELKTTNNDKQVCKFTVAVQDNEQTYFFNVASWGNQGEAIAKYCKKGSKIAVMGKLTQRSYENKDGVKMTAVEIFAQEVEFMSKGENKEKERPELTPVEDGQLPF